MTEFTLGVEEEFHLVDAASGSLRTAAPEVLAALGRREADEVDPELLRTQVEIQTPACAELAEIRSHLGRLRSSLGANAAQVGCRIAASGTWPGQTPPVPPTQEDRYEQIAARFGPTAREQTVCGAHVHVHVADRGLRMAAIRRARPWLATLLAISANSPFWRGADTGYGSYRWQVWSRWPMAGAPPAVQSAEEYDQIVEALLRTGVPRDEGMLYWDIREARRFDTVEFRVADVGARIEDTLLVAALVRALVQTCVEAERESRRCDDTRPELIRVALWRAARFGLTADLIDPVTGSPAPVADVVASLVEHVRTSLEEHGDLAFVRTGVEALLAGGTGAERQRAAFRPAGHMRDVVDLLVSETSG
ncbi:MAG: glutamate--cysteine ligase [Mycobacteriales bacterium]